MMLMMLMMRMMRMRMIIMMRMIMGEDETEEGKIYDTTFLSLI